MIMGRPRLAAARATARSASGWAMAGGARAAGSTGRGWSSPAPCASRCASGPARSDWPRRWSHAPRRRRYRRRLRATACSRPGPRARRTRAGSRAARRAGPACRFRPSGPVPVRSRSSTHKSLAGAFFASAFHGRGKPRNRLPARRERPPPRPVWRRLSAHHEAVLFGRPIPPFSELTASPAKVSSIPTRAWGNGDGALEAASGPGARAARKMDRHRSTETGTRARRTHHQIAACGSPYRHGGLGILLAGFLGGFVFAKATDALNVGKPGAISLFSGFGHPRGATAPRRGVPKPEGFAPWRQVVDSSGADPRACVEFTRPLDPRRSYADFVLISPDPGRAPAVTVKGPDDTQLCLTGLGFYDRRITFLKGFQAKNGEQLKANADIDFTFGAKPPYVGFAGEGVILPREDADGVGIETMNVARIAIEVWRVPDRNLVRKSISAPDATAEGEYAGDYGDDAVGSDGRKVWSGDVAESGPMGQRATTVFPLGAVLKEMKPGAYVIIVRDASGARGLKKKADTDDSEDANPAAQARRWILFTDMALVSYQGVDGTDVVVRSLKTARAMPGVKVSLVAQDGEDLASATSDGEGRVRFAKALFDGKGGEAAKAFMAYGPGSDFTTQSLAHAPVDLSNQRIGGRHVEGEKPLTAGRTASAVVDAYLYSDRGVYRPRETVRLVALLRDSEARAVKDRAGMIVVS